MTISEAEVPKSARILVVDDNDDIRNLVLFLLQKHGYEVDLASDGDLGLESIHEKKPDLVLLDVMMPRVSGLETLTAIRSSNDRDVANVKVVMMTAKSLTADVDEALARGADSYIVKPFRPASLIGRVEAMLSEEQ